MLIVWNQFVLEHVLIWWLSAWPRLAVYFRTSPYSASLDLNIQVLIVPLVCLAWLISSFTYCALMNTTNLHAVSKKLPIISLQATFQSSFAFEISVSLYGKNVYVFLLTTDRRTQFLLFIVQWYDLSRDEDLSQFMMSVTVILWVQQYQWQWQTSRSKTNEI